MNVELCPVSAIPARGSTQVDLLGRQVYVARDHAGEPAAFLRTDAHLSDIVQLPTRVEGGVLTYVYGER